MSVFEAGMIVCFGISWPVAILKTLKTRSVDGKSRTFLVLVLAGYGFGVLHKIFFNLDIILVLYVFNFSMVLIEICLWFRYHERPRSVAAAAARRDEAYDAAETLLSESQGARALTTVLPAIARGLAPRPPVTDAIPIDGVDFPRCTCRRR